MEIKEQLATIGQMFDAICLLIQSAPNIQEADAKRFSAFYPVWDKTKAYSNGTWLRWGANADGKPLLWATTKNVTANGGAPDVTPGAYRLIG